jgi:hypothetical protein
MPNGHDPNKPSPTPGTGSGAGTGTGTGAGGNGTVKPAGGSDKPPQTKLLIAAGIGGLVGGAVGALIGSCLHR